MTQKVITLAVRVLGPRETRLEFVNVFPKILAGGVILTRALKADVREGHQNDAVTLLPDLHGHDLRIPPAHIATAHWN